MTDHNLPATIDPSYGVDTYRTATNAATLCGEIVKATAQNIQGRKYVKVEGWLALAAAHGCLVSIAKVEMVEGGVRAVAELKRMADGLVLATAEGFVGEDEPMWQKRPVYARRAMAQTRASSRVCRSAFSHCVVLIDKNLGTTPAEEMDFAGSATIDHAPPEHAWTQEARKDGLMENAPAQKGADIAKAKENAAKCKARVDDALRTFAMVGQSAEILKTYWDANARQFEWIERHFPAEYERLQQAYDDALSNASARAA